METLFQETEQRSEISLFFAASIKRVAHQLVPHAPVKGIGVKVACLC